MENNIYIFGAHSRAQTLVIYLQYLYQDINIEAYLYNNDEPNPEKVGEVPVVSLYDLHTKLHTEYPVYIATRGVYHEKITEHLKQLGFIRIYPVTVELDMQLRNQYLEKYFVSIQREFIKIDNLEQKYPEQDRSAVIYVVKSAFDKPLEQPYQLDVWEREIQAGAALTDIRLLDNGLEDDIGDNISDKNRQFCELTVLYWIWKNAKEDIVGLAHYRRHFILPENWLAIMQDNGIDVILPTPLYVAPSLKENYKKRHEASCLEYAMQYLKEMGTEDYKQLEQFWEGNLYSPCNMFIMRREVLDSLCEWLFPILFATTGYGGQKQDSYQNRYPGFLSERLITYFFEKNSGKYKVIYADKNFLP